MSEAILEHVNVTVSDPDKTAAMLCDLFEWQIRWQGDSIHGGRSIHVGTDNHYLAVYAPPSRTSDQYDNYRTTGGLNHVGVVVSDLDKVEQKVKKAGFVPHSHADYEPGKRFYFNDDDGIEFEVVAY